MFVRVTNDGEQVWEGPLQGFLAANDDDEWLVETCKELEHHDRIEFSEISGDWVIVRID